MWFWFFMLICDMIVPAMMVLCGLMFAKTAPGEINDYFGYRTNMSKKNQDTWEYAHKYFGKIWLKWGIIMVPITVIAMLPIIGMNDNTVGIVGGIISFIQIGVIFVTVAITEKELKRIFDEDGNRR